MSRRILVLVATFMALVACSSIAIAERTPISLKWGGAQRISRVYFNSSVLNDTNPQANVFAAVTPESTMKVRITVEQTLTSTPDSYEIQVRLVGNGPIELALPPIRPVTPIYCTTDMARTLSYTQHTPNAALLAILQARYLLRGICGTHMQGKLKTIFLARLSNLSTELGHRVAISIE